MNLELRDQVGENMQSSQRARDVRQCKFAVLQFHPIWMNKPWMEESLCNHTEEHRAHSQCLSSNYVREDKVDPSG